MLLSSCHLDLVISKNSQYFDKKKIFKILRRIIILYSTLLLFKKNSSEKVILAGLGLKPTSPSSWEDFARALDHSATTTCWEIELNNRIYIDLKLTTTQKELEIHHGNFLWVSDSLSLPLIQKLLTDVYYQFSSKNSPLFSPSWVKIFFSKFFVKIFM